MFPDNTGPIDARIDWKREEQIWRLLYNYLLARLRMAVYYCTVQGAPLIFQEGITVELVCETNLSGICLQDLNYKGYRNFLSSVKGGVRRWDWVYHRPSSFRNFSCLSGRRIHPRTKCSTASVLHFIHSVPSLTSNWIEMSLARWILTTNIVGG